jgi:hypothetical protein
MKNLIILSFILLTLGCKKEKSDVEAFLACKVPSDVYGAKILIITLTDVNNNVVFKNKRVPIYAGLSKEIAIPAGKYIVTSVMIVNDWNRVSYIMPMYVQGKDYRDDYLPRYFEVTTVGPYSLFNLALLPVNETNVPSDFGYESFNIN